MYMSSISSFLASWMVLCLIIPFYSEAERSVPYEINDPVHYQFQSIQPESISLEEQFRSNVPKSSQYNVYHSKYNSLQPETSSKNRYSEANVKLNVARSMPKYQLGKVYRPNYYSQFVGNRESLKGKNAARLERVESQEIDKEIMKKMNMLDKMLFEDTDETNVEKNTVEDRIIAEMNISEETKRVVRQVRRQRPGFFWTLARLAFEGVSKSRVRRQDVSAQSDQLIDDIFNIPITAIRQTASAAQVISPENTQTIDNIFKIPVSTLEAVGTFVKTAREQRQRNSENNQERRERILAIKEQKRKRKEEIQNQRLLQQQLKRTVRHHRNDPLGLNALNDLLVGHHHSGGLLGHHSGLYDIHKLHGGHKIGHGNLEHGGHLGSRPQHTYKVHEDVNEDTSFSWHGLIAGIGNFYGTRPSSTSIKIENKIAPKEKKISKYPSDDVIPQNKIAKIRNKLIHEYDDPPLENKIAPRNGKITFVQ